jgi:hypothetical protein
MLELEVATHNNGVRGGLQHPGMGVDLHYFFHHVPLVDDHKVPGLQIYCGRGVHGSSQNTPNSFIINLLIGKPANASTVQDMLNHFHKMGGS